MSDYLDKIAEIIDEEDVFASTISFSEESIQIDFMDRAQQSATIMMGNTAIIAVADEERLEAYRQIQDLARLLIRDAFVTRRLENES